MMFAYYFQGTFVLINIKNNCMKKLMTMAVAVLLVSGAAFAGGKKGGDKSCCKKEGKSCQKEKKADKTTSTAPSTPKS